MIEFNEKEIKYIKENMDNVLEIFNKGSKKELQTYIEEIGGSMIDVVIMFSRNGYKLLDKVNEIDYLNDKIIDFVRYGMGMWVWTDAYMESAEEVFEYVPDVTYCGIYEKLISEED
ncbi:hypothetical protein D9O40_16770 [Clostridium autoethanogenum]|uniref:Uncharacterized protein n=2 Tax=Clostridium autoethanogenum TaxID=84023 RepID=A0A3M0SBC4_9CLOT|nr:hypothetical protein D9O40_16770 [Clostridium autoethanogenum]